jgi:hypothetical protein
MGHDRLGFEKMVQVVLYADGETDPHVFVDNKLVDLREYRNKLLEETDVWALSDRTMTAEQTAYRQALRDITDQAGFPTDITWPTKPE